MNVLRNIYPNGSHLVITDIDNESMWIDINSMVAASNPPHVFQETIEGKVFTCLVVDGHTLTLPDQWEPEAVTKYGVLVEHRYSNVASFGYSSDDQLRLLLQDYVREDLWPLTMGVAVSSMSDEIHYLSSKLCALQTELAMFDLPHMHRHTAWIPYVNKLGELF